MKVGDVVTVYEDPMTQQKPEGEARLLKLLKDEDDSQYWRVTFVKDKTGEQFNRWIKKDDIKERRMFELLAYAKVCFDKCTSPFETVHLAKKNVTADECVELSQTIAEIIEDELDYRTCVTGLRTATGPLSKELIAQAEKDFAETQK